MKRVGNRLPLWRLLLLILALLGFGLFFWPVLAGFVDLSNLSGMGACLALAAAMLWWKPLLRLLGWLWRRLWGRILLLATGVGLAALTVLLLVLSCLVISRLQVRPKRECPTLLVLGCQVRGQTPSLHLRYRIDAAADYLLAHPEAVAVLSGGKGDAEELSEAACMERELIARGIAPERLYLEEASTDTRENLSFSAALMEQAGLRGPVLIVSNSFHMYRALRMAEDLGLDAEGLAARSRPANLPVYVLREAMALVKYGLTNQP